MSRERLLAPERHRHILDELHRRGTVRVAQLSAELGVSELTIRRDISQLADQALLTRVHGGAVSPEPAPGRAAPEATAPAERSDAEGLSIGMVVPSLDFYWPSIVAGVRETAERLGVAIQLRGSSYDAEEDRRQIARLVETHRVDGLLLAPNLEADGAAVLDQIIRLPVPTVLVEREPARWTGSTTLDAVRSDHALGVEMAVRHLHDQGHRRIGLVLSKGSPTSAHLALGWQTVCADLDIPADLVVRASVGLEVPGHREVIAELMRRCRDTATTALVVHSDPDALSLLQYCAETGVAVPDDLALVSYDDEVAALADPALTAVRPPKFSVGRVAVELMHDRLSGPADAPGRRVLITPALHVRESSVSRAAQGPAAAANATRPRRRVAGAP